MPIDIDFDIIFLGGCNIKGKKYNEKLIIPTENYDSYNLCCHAMLFKKELLKYIFPFPKLMYFDAWIAAVASSFEGVKYVDIDLVKYRQHDTNSIANKKLIK